jgi:hypothetical protein
MKEIDVLRSIAAAFLPPDAIKRDRVSLSLDTSGLKYDSLVFSVCLGLRRGLDKKWFRQRVVFDWTKNLSETKVNLSHLSYDIDQARSAIERNGGRYDWRAPADLHVGYSPDQAAKFLDEGIRKLARGDFDGNNPDSLPIFVCHSLFTNMIPMLYSSMARATGHDWTFAFSRFQHAVDLSVVEKAIQEHVFPYAGDDWEDFQDRVLGHGSRGAKFSLIPHCVDKYDLIQKVRATGVDPDSTHVTTRNALLIDQLAETYLEMLGNAKVS